MGETRFKLEACARAPAQMLYAHSMTCQGESTYLSHSLQALQAEENVVCNLECSIVHLDSCCHVPSRKGALGQEVALQPPCSSTALGLPVLLRDMPGPPVRSTLDNQTLRRQQVGNPKLFGVHPNNHFLKAMYKYQRMDMFNGIFRLSLDGRFFQQAAVSKDFWTEGPRSFH